MDRSLIILIAVAFTLGLYAIRLRRRAKKELEEANSRRREELIQQALDRWFEFDLLEALDALYQERVGAMVLLESDKSFSIFIKDEIHDRKTLERDKKILMAEMIRLRKGRIEAQRAQIERESGFEVIHSAQI